MSFCLFSYEPKYYKCVKKEGIAIRKINKLVSMFFAICLLIMTGINNSITVAAFEDEPEKNEISVISNEEVYDIDGSELDVEVIKQSGDEKTTIFTGKLKDYDNGRWIHLDFSKVQFFVIFEWEGPSDEAVCIIPIKESNITNTQKAEHNISSKSLQNKDNVQTNEIYEYGIHDIEVKNANNERVNALKNGVVLSAVTISKNTDKDTAATIYAAIYDDGKLKDLKMVPVDLQQSNKSYTKYDLNLILGEITPKTSVKLMVWNGNNLIPYALNLDMFYNFRNYIQVTANQTYTFPVLKHNQGSKFKISYDEKMFSVIDLCKDTLIYDVQTGVVSDNIRIDEISNGSFVFSVIGDDNAVCVNRFVLKANMTGTTYIEVEEMAD